MIRVAKSAWHWQAGAYKATEDANRFIYNLETAWFYNEEDAGNHADDGRSNVSVLWSPHDMVVMFGDIPFTFPSGFTTGGVITSFYHGPQKKIRTI